MRTALVTGSSGFIGFHVCNRLLTEGFRVVGIDDLNDYYDVDLKRDRQAILCRSPSFKIVNDSIEAPDLLLELFKSEKPDVVVHLAAQAGVRYSIANPRAYLDSNICGTFELLEAARATRPQHLLLASTSSVYGANTQMPYAEVQQSDHQMSFYAATKKATEAMAHSYAHLFNLPITMFRFFTVYGPWGRPDMALFKFTRAIIQGQPIDVYNHGKMQRDFTYIDDLVHAIRLLTDCPPARPAVADDIDQGDSLSPVAPFRSVNIGNSSAVALSDFISAIETATQCEAQKNYLPIQPGDVPATWADNGLLRRLTGYVPQTTVNEGVANFVEWYRDYYGTSRAASVEQHQPPNAN